MHFVAYLRAHGNDPGRLQHPLIAGAIAGAVAAAAGASIAFAAGAHDLAASALGLPIELIVALDVGWMISMAIVFARVFGRAVNDPAASWLFGMSYGFLLWILGPVMVLDKAFGIIFLGGPARGALASFLVFGLVLGLIYPHIHRPLIRRAWRKSSESSESSESSAPASGERLLPGEGKGDAGDRGDPHRGQRQPAPVLVHPKV